MPGPDRRPSDDHGDVTSTTEGSAVVPGQEVMNMPPSSPPELNVEVQRGDVSWSPDGDQQGCGQLETRWILWQEFMKEHAHLDDWLQLAEQAVSSLNPAHVTYVTAKEEVRKFERLCCDAGSRLVQLDSLTQRNRTLTGLFQGAMQARLLAAARECGRRWDEVNARLVSITARLKLFVSEWEGFETEREELSLWLAELDIRLAEVDHLTGNTCEKLRCLQSFQQCVCVNSTRVNALLRRGEALIQSSKATDAQHVERRLLELLRHCSHLYNNITRTHTRLLSMRLVFEDDWILSQATDSGCPSESLLEEEGALDKSDLDVPVMFDCPEAFSSPVHLLPPPPSPSSPSHEHLGLEWDPSVDIGRSVSRDDADSSYFSVGTARCHRDGVKRRSYFSSLGSLISNDNQEEEERAEASRNGPDGDRWATSTPDRQDSEPVSFDGGRVRAWLGVQSPAFPRTTSCSRAVQTEWEVKCLLDRSHINTPDVQHHHDNLQHPVSAPSSQPRDLKASSDWVKHQLPSNLQAEEEESSCCDEAEHLLSEQSSGASSSLLSPALLCLLLAAALALLACLIWISLEPPCQRSSRLPRSFHLTLRYVNGPPPT